MALTNKLTAIGDAIRTKTGSTDLMTLEQMATSISGISNSATLEELTVTENGVYTPTNSDGYSKVTVNVESTGGSTEVWNSLWTNGTWEEISNVLTSYYNGEITDLSPYFRVGDMRDISVGAMESYGGKSGKYVCEAREATTMPWVIIGIQHDDLATATDAGVTKAAFTIIPRYNYTNKVYFGTDASSHAYSNIREIESSTLWENSQARNWCINRFYPAIQEECRNLIKPVIKNTLRVHQDNSALNKIFTTTDNVWLLSQYEVTGYSQLSDKIDGVRYEWFTDGENGSKFNKIRFATAEAEEKANTGYVYGLRNGLVYYQTSNGSTKYYGYCYYVKDLSVNSGLEAGINASQSGSCMGMCL